VDLACADGVALFRSTATLPESHATTRFQGAHCAASSQGCLHARLFVILPDGGAVLLRSARWDSSRTLTARLAGTYSGYAAERRAISETIFCSFFRAIQAARLRFSTEQTAAAAKVLLRDNRFSDVR